MSHTRVYEKILASMPDGIRKSIMEALTAAFNERPGENVTKAELILKVYGTQDNERNRVNSTKDRQIRDAIADLQLQGYPIVASSGKAGYRLAVNPEDAAEYLAELESRKAQLEAKITALRRNTYPAFWKVEYSEPARATQPALI